MGNPDDVTESPHVQPSRPDASPAAADPGHDLEPASGAGEHLDPDVIADDDESTEASTGITDAVRHRSDPPFRTPAVG